MSNGVCVTVSYCMFDGVHVCVHACLYVHVHAMVTGHSAYTKDIYYCLYTVSLLSYWTDNGACYYYYTGHFANYEDAMIGVKTYAVEQDIPFRYLQVGAVV